ncbi:speckle-type POZ protein [Trichonephila clavata]|uniref:Speckle-type POZ protein n=1 Tax=Trichonephila clavata TaxID=2740835 RepID=A0A8X6FBP5_TRICU|nr:speckle-type POZ protein [Trichonephila clavata]
MANNDEENTLAPFTYFWAIENCPEFLSSTYIVSPVFIVEDIQSEWCLKTGTEGLFILCFIERQRDSGPEMIEIYLELSLLDTYGHPLIKVSLPYSFMKGDIFERRTFARINDVFLWRRKNFLSYDTLTFRCRIAKVNVSVSRRNVCYARTRLDVHRKSFIWLIRQFNSLRVGDKVSYHLVVTEGESLLLALTLTESYGVEKVHITIETSPRVKFKVRISILDFLGKRHITVNHVRVGRMIDTVHLTEKRVLDRVRYFPFNILTLRCEFLVGCGVKRSGIEGYTYPPSGGGSY